MNQNILEKCWFLPMLLLLLSTCSNNNKSSRDTLTRAKVGNSTLIQLGEIEQSVKFNELTDSIQYVVLQSIDNGSTFIGDVDKIIYHNDRFYVLDARMAKGLFCFSATGVHLFSINSRGNGPGEFVNITDFDIREGFIYLYDEGNGRLSIFDLEGNYLKTCSRFSAYGILPDCFSMFKNSYVLHNKNDCNDAGCNTIQIVDFDAGLIGQGVNNSHLSGFNVDLGTPIARNGSEIVFTQTLNDSIYIMNEDHSIEAPYVVDFGKYALSPKEKNEVINNPMQIADFLSQSFKSPGFAYVNLNEDFILLTFVQNGAFPTLLINRETNHSKAFRNYNFEVSQSIPVYTVVGNHKNQFIFYRGNENSLNFSNSLVNLNDHPYGKMLENLDDDTNGIIALAKFKSF